LPPKKLQNIEVVEKNTNPEFDKGRISWIDRYRVKNQYEDGSFSKVYNLDVFSHKGLDAVGVIPYWKDNGKIMLTLLKSFRPALSFRSQNPETSPFLVEIIAGVLEAGEDGGEGAIIRAKEELHEEAGILVESKNIYLLGKPFYCSPGLYTEKLWICAVEIDPLKKVEPTLDGSVMEELIEAFPVTLAKAREMCLNGEIKDAKTEIALERLYRALSDKENK